MSAENTYHFNLRLNILDILAKKPNLTKDEIVKEIMIIENIASLDEYKTKNIKERVFNSLKKLSASGRITLTKHTTPIKTFYYTASLNQK